MKTTFLVLLILLFYGTGFAATVYYVDANSTATPPSGTQNKPYLTIQDALNLAVDGDTVIVKPAVYPESLKLTQAILLKGTDTATCIIEPPAPLFALFIDTNISGSTRVKFLTIRQGATQYGHPMDDAETELLDSPPGDGIIVYAGHPVLDNVVISGFSSGVVGMKGFDLTNSVVSGNGYGVLTMAGGLIQYTTFSLQIDSDVECADCTMTISSNDFRSQSNLLYDAAPESDPLNDQIISRFLSPDAPQLKILKVQADSAEPLYSIVRGNLFQGEIALEVFTLPPDFGTASDPGKNTFTKSASETFKNDTQVKIFAIGNAWPTDSAPGEGDSKSIITSSDESI